MSLLIIMDHQFAGLCRALGCEALLDDPRTRSLGDRMRHAGEINPLLMAEVAKLTTGEVVKRAREHDVPLAPVHDVAAFVEDPQAVANETFVTVEDEEAGTLRLVGNPARFSATPTEVRHTPPRFGAQTQEILKEAGYDETQILQLRESGAIPFAGSESNAS